ncbi:MULTISPECIES: TadE family type IV pilus minor pilin [Nocardiopsidaceae]|uniref:Pilus assembly protein n=2 Tax=Nocardiopsidaceae TaxID=83676 RepID=A0ABY6YN15_9ACTN|nr:TadE family type IV pilus minor pilin [Streptomonospora nanhaiensis]MEE2045302.1 TadE family type IV pilus minor pilin [Nocardiopsis tropica]WAE73684.1 pilus assembly protein [Streptomonospora nanhaiensis]
MRSARGSDRGSVTVEAALTLPSLLLVLAVSFGAVQAASAQLACADAARVGARALARGEPDDRARSLALTAAPRGADVGLADDGHTARVTVRVELRLGPLAPPLGVDGSAAVLLEPGS